MRRTIKQVLAAFLVGVCLAAGSFTLTSSAATLGMIDSSDSKEGSWYKNTFQGTDWYFQSTVPSGGKSIGDVTVRLPAGYTMTEVWTAGKAEISQDGGSKEYKFHESGSYALKIETPAKGGGALYGSFRFEIMPSGDKPGNTPRMENSGSAQVYRVVSLGDNANYMSNVTEGAAMTEPAVFRLSSSVTGMVTYGGATVPYESGTELTKTGRYEMRLTATDALGSVTESVVQFSIGEIKEQEPLIPVYTPLVSAEQSVNPNLFYNGTLLVGNWTAQAAFKNDAAMGEGFFEDPEEVAGSKGGDGSGDGGQTGGSKESGRTEGSGNTESGEGGRSEGSGQTGDGESGRAEENGEDGKSGGLSETGVKVMEAAKVRPLEIKQISSAPKTEEGEEDAERGPGVTEAAAAGPEKIQVELTERYHEEYQMYELSFANRYFFYSNIGDGGITSRNTPVIFDVPANIAVEAQKDGIGIPYNNKAPITEPGTYVMHLSVTDNPELPAEEQTIYQAVYHFRIEEKEPETTSPAADSEVLYEGYPAYGPLSGQVAETPSQPAVSESEETSEETAADETAEEQTTAAAEETTEAAEEPADPLEDPNSTLAGSGLEESYDSAKDLYAEKLISGSVFYSSVPNGMITAVPVTFEIPESLTIRMTRNDKEYEFDPAKELTEDGIYRMEIDENRVGYVTGYTSAPFFTFRIAANPVRDLKIYNAPKGYTILSASKNGETLEIGAGQEYCTTDGDGQYQFVLLSEDGVSTLTSVVTLDQEPPQFEVQGLREGENTGSEIRIAYHSDDINRVVLYRNGEETADFDGNTVTKSGSYLLEVYDKAGNKASASFRVKYRMNLAAVMAVLLVAALVVTTVLYIKKVKKNVSVR